MLAVSGRVNRTSRGDDDPTLIDQVAARYCVCRPAKRDRLRISIGPVLATRQSLAVVLVRDALGRLAWISTEGNPTNRER